MSSVRISPDVVARAAAAGCTSAELEETAPGSSRFRVHCTCGYSSTTRTSRPLAVEALAHHLAKVAGARVVNGVSRRASHGLSDPGDRTRSAG